MPIYALSRKMSKSDPPLWGEPPLFRTISTFRNIRMIGDRKSSNPGRKNSEIFHRGRRRDRLKSKNSIFGQFSISLKYPKTFEIQKKANAMVSAYLISRRLPSLVEIGATLLPKRQICLQPPKKCEGRKTPKTKFFRDAPV